MYVTKVTSLQITAYQRVKLSFYIKHFDSRYYKPKLNDVNYLTNIVMNACEPIFEGFQNNLPRLNQAIQSQQSQHQSGPIVTIDINQIKALFREYINRFFLDYKDTLNLLAKYTKNIMVFIICLFVYFVGVSLYLLIKRKWFIVSFFAGIISVILTLAFTILVIYVVNDLKYGLTYNIKDITIDIKNTVILNMTSTYILCLLFLIHLVTKPKM